MSGPLRFRELVVRRMPGFPDGGLRLDDLSDGINLVHGPNASGKTTTARALQRLLWTQLPPAGAAVAGRFTLDGTSWSVDVDGSRVVWQRDGHPASPPALPGPGSSHRYFLPLHELLVRDDADLAERIRTESVGGYDLPAAAKALGFGAAGRPRKLVDALGDARAALKAARADASRAREERTELEDRRRRQESLRRKAATVAALERALDLARAREDRAAAERDLAVFPDELAKLRGDELERLEQWAEAAAARRDEIARAETDESAARAALDAAGLGAEGVPAVLLAGLDRALERVRQCDAELARLRGERADAGARRRHAGSLLGIEEREEPGPDVAAAGAERLDRFIRRAESLRQRRTALTEWLRQLRGEDPEGGTGGDAGAEDAALEDAIRALRAWLRGGSGDGAARRRLERLVTGSALGFGLLGLVLVTTASPLGMGAGAAALIAAVALLLLRPRAAADGRGELEEEVKRLGHAPDRWQPEAVRTRLDALERRAAERVVAAERRREAERHERGRPELEREEAELEAEREALARDLGIDAGTDVSLYLTATRLRDLDEALRAEAAAGARVDEAAASREAVLAGAREELAPYGYEPADADDLAAAVADLRDRRATHEQAAAAFESARKDRERAARELAELTGRRRALFVDLGLPEEDEHTLRALSDRLEAYGAARRRLEVASHDVAKAEAALGAVPGGEAFADEPPDALARELEDATAAAQEEREAAKRIAALERGLEDARRKHDVEDALARVEAARAALADQRDRDIDAEGGAALVEWLQAESADHERPAVFHRARELLTVITRGRYRLDLAEEGDTVAFRAYDTTTARGHALDELSSGTRLQLLLAVRVAFVETQEHGAAPPLLLDEVLANCDEHRARAIIEATIGLARAGRQIFYFTAQADELVKWRSVLEAQDEVAWCERGLAAPADGPAFEWGGAAPAADALPSPEGLSHHDYGRAIAVPAFDPWADGVDGLHLWYLVDDVDALDGLLRLGVERWGQLEHYVRTARDGAPDALRAVYDDARRVAALCDHFRALRRRGRGRPVDRAVLDASGAVSDTFLDPAAALCEELDGDAARLIDALERGEVPRFRNASTEELRTFFLDRGYISEDAPLEDEAIRIRLLAEAERTGAGLEPESVDRLIERLAYGPGGVAAG